MSERFRELYELIDRAESFDEVRSSGLLPEPDSDDGYYFVSYCHRDYKSVVRDIAALGEGGAHLWYDRGLESGKSWIGEVKQKMSSYYCKGVIFYISKNYLNSPSCLMELDHFFTLITKSALFITVDTELSDDGSELSAALSAHGYDPSGHVFLSDGALFLMHDKLALSATAEEKLALAANFAEPELIEYTYLYGVNDITHKVIDAFFGRLATVTGIADKNVRRVVIPSYVEHGGKKYRVAGISPSAFMQCDMLEEVVLSDGWMTVDRHAFIRCSSLRRLVLGKPRRFFGTSMGIVNDVFDRCPNAEIIFDGEIKYRDAFKGREDINEAVHEGGEIWYGECFAGCKNLTRAVLSRSDDYGGRMFGGCSALAEITIPKNNVTRRLDRSFEGCTSLLSVELSERVREIGNRAFAGCTSLSSVRIPRRVRFIARDAFRGCDGIESVTVDTKKMRNYEDNPYRRSCLLDELFPSAKAFYLRHAPRGKAVFEGDFVEVASDKRGYKKYIRRADFE